MGIYELGHQDQVETGYDCKAEDIEMHGKNVHILLRMHKNVFRYIVYRTTYYVPTVVIVLQVQYPKVEIKLAR